MGLQLLGEYQGRLPDQPGGRQIFPESKQERRNRQYGLAGGQGRRTIARALLRQQICRARLDAGAGARGCPQGIRVNALCPGFVKTSMQEREVAWEAKLRGLSSEQVIKEYV